MNLRSARVSMRRALANLPRPSAMMIVLAAAALAGAASTTGRKPPCGAGQPAGRPLSRVGRLAAALPGRRADGRQHDGRRRRPAGRAPSRERGHARRLDRERRLRPHRALAPGDGFRPTGLRLQRPASRPLVDAGRAGAPVAPGMPSPRGPPPDRRRPLLGNAGRSRVGAPGAPGGSGSRPARRLLLSRRAARRGAGGAGRRAGAGRPPDPHDLAAAHADDAAGHVAHDVRAAPRPDRFQQVFPKALIPRPKQIHAMSQEGATMVPAAAALRRHYGDVRCPSIVMTGDADRVVDPEDQSIRLAHELKDAELRILPGAGHMVHHAFPLEVAEAINRVVSGHGRLQEVA